MFKFYKICFYQIQMGGYFCSSKELREVFLTVVVECGLLEDALTAFERVRQSANNQRLREIFDSIRKKLCEEWRSPDYKKMSNSILNAIFIMEQCAKYGRNQIEPIHIIMNVVLGFPTQEQRFNAVHLLLPQFLANNEPLNEQHFRRYIENFELTKMVEPPLPPPPPTQQPSKGDECAVCLEEFYADEAVRQLRCKVIPP